MGTNLIEKINTTVEIDIYGFGGDGGGRFTGKGEYIGEILLQEPEKTKTTEIILKEVNTIQSKLTQIIDNDNTYANGRGETIGVDEDGDVGVLKYKNGPGGSPFEDPEEYREKI